MSPVVGRPGLQRSADGAHPFTHPCEPAPRGAGRGTNRQVVGDLDLHVLAATVESHRDVDGPGSVARCVGEAFLNHPVDREARRRAQVVELRAGRFAVGRRCCGPGLQVDADVAVESCLPGQAPLTAPFKYPGDGVMQIRDRTKDVIKTGGEWISSIDLESAAVAHPAVAMAAVIGVKHPKWDERPLLFIVRKPGQSVEKEEMLAFLAERVAKWWVPDDVVFLESLPVGGTGKVQKADLRKNYGGVFS